MANIQPFKAIRSNPVYADQLVFTSLQVESVSGDETKDGSLAPLKTLLETGARLRPETPEGQAKAFQDIKETLKTLLESDKLWHEQAPGIYVYEVEHKTYRQTGIWALTSLEDYTQGNIKIHELTFADSIRRLTNYRKNTGLEGSPILLAYHPDITINRIIAETIKNSKKITYGNDHGLHHLWKIEDPAIQQHLINAFAKVKNVYLADGHHRIESSALLAAEQRANGLTEFDYISSLYMATDQLRIEEYDRVVLPSEIINIEAFFDQLKQHFDIQPAHQQVQPRKPHQFGMYFEKNWYGLTAKPHLYNNKNAAANLDTYILQETVLAPIFGIADPKTDQRLKCAGGEMAMEEINAILNVYPDAIVFTLCPVSVEQLIEVAEAGEILPPKSTWIVPKIPYALLLHHHLTE
ncbi:MAG: DUF1015 domain-containing protein [Bacteroidetes bacterium]|jgi:uncharacterized protein (DUF1015 family)|nr:DUF1015 domain-containing protein [Bacteroidota bacterium]